jgi:transposase
MELTNEQWNRIGPIIVSSIPSKDPRGRPARDPRKVLNGILWILRTGAPKYNHDRPHRGYRNQGRRPMETFELGKIRREELLKEAA